MTRRSAVLAMVAMLGAVYIACGYCDEPPKVKSGTYILAPEGSVEPGYEWLVGSEIVIDRESGAATIRYTREGTVYDVQFELEE